MLVECVRWGIAGKRGVSDDPLVHLQEFLTGRKIAAPEWFEKTENAARERLFAKKSTSKGQ